MPCSSFVGREPTRHAKASIHMTDAELIKKTLNGQTSAFEVIVRRWSARLTAFVLSRVRRVDVAEDLAQECLLRSFRNLATLRQPERYGSWLFSIANMAAIDWMKAKARTEVSFEGATDFTNGCAAWTSDAPTPEENCCQLEDDQRLMDEVMALPDALREVILIYYYDDVTYKDMAEMLGVSTATINVRLTKARATLREKLTTFGRST